MHAWREEALRGTVYTSPLRTRLNNIEYFPPNFEALVLGCIDADFCKWILVGKLSPRSTQCTPLHRFGIHNRKMGKNRSLISIFSSKIVNIFSRLNNWISDFFQFIPKYSSNFAFFLRNVDEFFSGFRAKFQKRVTSVAFQSILRKQILTN